MAEILPVNMAGQMQDIVNQYGTQPVIKTQEDKQDAFLTMFVQQMFLDGGMFGSDNSIFKPEQEQSMLPFNTYSEIANSQMSEYLVKSGVLPEYFTEFGEEVVENGS